MRSASWSRDGFPKYSKEEIARSAETLFSAYVERFGFERVVSRGYSFDDVYEEIIRPLYRIELDEDSDLGFDDQGRKIIGLFDSDANRAQIDRGLRPGTGDPRRAFTCWHEVGGHGILHGEWLRSRRRRGAMSSAIVTTADGIGSSSSAGLERQANSFAAHAAAPKEFVLAVAINVLGLTRSISYRGPGAYELNPNGRRWWFKVATYEALCLRVASTMRHRFGGLSVEALSYRLRDLSIVVDRTIQRARLYRTAG